MDGEFNLKNLPLKEIKMVLDENKYIFDNQESNKDFKWKLEFKNANQKLQIK